MKRNDYKTEQVYTKALLDGESIFIPSPNAKNHNTIGFCAKLDSFIDFEKIVISHGKTNPWCSAYVEIDAREVRVYKYHFERILVETLPHGLSISDFLNVSIRVGAGFSAKLVLTSSSGAFVKTVYWNGSLGNILAESVGAKLSNATLTYYVNGVEQDIWLFGDSYFDHWCQHLVDWGFTDFYLDGYSGRSSEHALASLRKNLSYGKPQKLVWLMGMNDEDHGQVNGKWLASYRALAQICAENAIELILATVPNTPTRDHKYKNEVVKKSGYRYLDICGAVGADGDPGWHQGLIDSDNVHPSLAGAQAIAGYVLSVLPEIK